MRSSHLLLALTLVTTQAANFAFAQWDIEESHTTASLRGIHNVGGGVAWASGTNGTVLRTEDGGYLWQTCAIPPGSEKLDFRGVQAFDENTAIVMSSGPGDQSRLYKTTDGCQTWKLVFINPDKDGFWDAIQLEPLRTGYLNGILIGDPVDGNFAIFITSDGGNNWRKWGRNGSGWKGPCGERNAKAANGEAIFAASNQSLLFSTSVYPEFLFVTGGKSRARLVSSNYSEWDGPPCSTSFMSDRLDFGGGGSSSGAFAQAITKWDGWLPEKVMVVGGDYTKPEEPSRTSLLIQKTGFHVPFSSYFENPVIAQTQPHGYRSSVAYDADQKLWITVGPNGTDISTDDGKNWRPLTPSPTDPADADKNWNALSLPFVVGPHGRIGRLRTIDQKAAVTKKP
ncbi:WD40/YVTN/BNR-like repeat-containing protein [Tunturiibacter gelidoferens]|uniref:Photosynthesis system II assembly factor Ycf48/Hcf136-like domain-containing protein n=1 Tax=Tunturiibacter lichenicola TaxID=2051959 RepID=A0A7Y9NP40_9BACT|nr:hypothetical protein [Edaphobacter lichenicola]NYF52936.1 hypothetical protein [Edaphobacter lichenicola]